MRVVICKKAENLTVINISLKSLVFGRQNETLCSYCKLHFHNASSSMRSCNDTKGMVTQQIDQILAGISGPAKIS